MPKSLFRNIFDEALLSLAFEAGVLGLFCSLAASMAEDFEEKSNFRVVIQSADSTAS